MGCGTGKTGRVVDINLCETIATLDNTVISADPIESFRPSVSSASARGPAGSQCTASYCTAGSSTSIPGHVDGGHPLERPKRLVLIRHGESEANVDRRITQGVPDHALHLTARGREQALDAGERLHRITTDQSVQFIISPYVRTRETFNGIQRAFSDAKNNVREDVQMREQDFGNFDKPDVKELHKEKAVFGRFYYRFPEGESLADVYDRASLFLEGLYRQWEYSAAENLVLVSHGLWIHVFLMRLFGYSVEQFYELDAIRNCEFIVLEMDPCTQFYEIVYTWPSGETKQYEGLRKIKSNTSKATGVRTEIWDGDPSRDLIVSKTYTPLLRRLDFFHTEHRKAVQKELKEPEKPGPSGLSVRRHFTTSH